MDIPKHQFDISQRVKIKLYDWGPEGKILSKIVTGKIAAQIFEPFGYDVELFERTTFIGNVPFSCKKQGFKQITHNSTIVDTLFAREYTIAPAISVLKNRLMIILNGLIFRRVNAAYVKPEGQIDYINVHTPGGPIMTISDDRSIKDILPDATDIDKRLAYKVPHFYGFTKNYSEYESSVHKELKGSPIHFTVNRYSMPNFWGGLTWDAFDAGKVFLPKVDYLICGSASQIKDDRAASFDKWFICSNEFMLFCKYIYEVKPESEDETKKIIQSLIIPLNTENYYVAHEHPLTRYLYAAIYMLAVLDDKDLPAEWNLPERMLPGAQRMVPFAEWWPKILLSESNE